MREYSDTTSEVFKQTLDQLEGKVPERLHTSLRDLLRDGEFHDPDAIARAIREVSGSTSADQG
jgi:hypothetical protein